MLHTGFPRYREFGKGPGISKMVFPVMKIPGICNFHHVSVNRPGIWFALGVGAHAHVRDASCFQEPILAFFSAFGLSHWSTPNV